MKLSRPNSFCQKNQPGFSLVELLVVIVMMLIVFGAIFSLMRSSIITANANYEMTDATQSLRNAQEFISRDMITAGDGLRGIGAVWLPTGFVTQRLTVRSAAILDPTASGYVNIGGVISDDNIPNGIPIINSDPLLNFRGTSDRITFLSVDPTFTPITVPAGGTNFGVSSIAVPPASIGSIGLGEIYFVASGVNAAFGTVTKVNGGDSKIFWENGDAYGLNRSGSNGTLAKVAGPPTPGDPSLPSTLLRMQMIQYFVDQQGKLIRRVYGVRGTGFSDSVIAEHLTTLQFLYTLRPEGASNLIYELPASTVDVGDPSRVRLVETMASVETANQLQDGAKHQVDGTVRIGLRNMQFSEAAMPR